jgi:hypothetical protein
MSPPPHPSSTRRSRRSLHKEDFDDDLSTIPDNYNVRQDHNSESHDEPLWRPFRKAIGKWPSKDSFKSTLGKQVAATQFTATSAQPLHPECQQFPIVSEEENEREPAPLVSKKVSNYAFK